ncbi:hypothetical protein [Mesobacillus foraminis]|uniref:hypothetical protein n=1 Tax=Mesobacillus foraminis TaxID=279826 RepID=UPI0015E68D7F|nr:hypothetical protein [Mesobacillus foraminis]
MGKREKQTNPSENKDSNQLIQKNNDSSIAVVKDLFSMDDGELIEYRINEDRNITLIFIRTLIDV